MMNEELKPCPFCGGKAVIEDSLIKVDGCFIGCTKYGCRGTVRNGVLYPDKEAAVIAWNTRYEPTCKMEKVLLYDEECVEGIECDECGWSEIHDHSEPIPYTHCPNCKAKVEA